MLEFPGVSVSQIAAELGMARMSWALASGVASAAGAGEQGARFFARSGGVLRESAR